jgi:hypothetical protein
MITVSTLYELRENVYFKMQTYIETHPGVDRDQFVESAINEALARRARAERMNFIMSRFVLCALSCLMLSYLVGG